MSDLSLNEAVFQSLKKTFFTISDRVEATRRGLRGSGASVVGEGQLVSGIQDFVGEWSYGVMQLGKHTHGTVELINHIGDTFGKLDLDLAESLKTAHAKRKGKQPWPASTPRPRTYAETQHREISGTPAISPRS
ncbi:hypothetical protein ACIQ6R_00290 [Streptomyces sp. NPDC096048]|uniref:hypothetical protein n=1 Tax=Streptomyces sp. NPDC096048 TaxID=3366072 RepID=UPI0037F75D15